MSRRRRGTRGDGDGPGLDGGRPVRSDGGPWPLWCAAGCWGATAAMALRWVPWAPGMGWATVVPQPARDFTAAQIARQVAFHGQIRPWADSAWLLGLAVPAVLGFTPVGSRVVAGIGGRRRVGAAAARAGRRGARAGQRRWWLTVPLAVGALTAVSQVITLPLRGRAEVVLREYGLSTQDWTSWLADLARGWGVQVVAGSVLALLLVGSARAWPRRWWLVAAGGVAVLAVAGSYAYPLLVEPLFNRFTPLPSGPLRSDLLALAAREGVSVRDVLVADASRRTTATNAYVSGLGGSRRIVVYDTLLRDLPRQQAVSIVAHELGHVRHRDVPHASAMGAVGGAGAVCLLGWVLARPDLLRRSGLGDVPRRQAPGDPRVVALLLALSAVGGLASAPAGTFVSRRVEAHADLAALDATRDPATFVAMQRRLAVTNITDLAPRWWETVLFATHPSPPWRIAMARRWQRMHPEPGSPA